MNKDQLLGIAIGKDLADKKWNKRLDFLIDKLREENQKAYESGAIGNAWGIASAIEIIENLRKTWNPNFKENTDGSNNN